MYVRPIDKGSRAIVSAVLQLVRLALSSALGERPLEWAAGNVSGRLSEFDLHMIKVTATREITPYRWVHPDEE